MASVLAAAILAWVVAEDVRRFRIRNVAVLGLVAAFGLRCLLARDLAPILPHAVFATLGLAALAIAFYLGWIGGGDAKLLSAALLWVGPEAALPFAILLLAGTLFYAAGSHLGWLPNRTVAGHRFIPFGPPVAAAWLGVMALSAALAA